MAKGRGARSRLAARSYITMPLLAVAAVSLGGCLGALPQIRNPAPAPVARRFGVSVSTVSQLPAIAALGQSLTRSPDLIDFYVGWGTSFPSESASAIAARGAEPEITWEPWNYQLGVSQDTWPLQSISAGTFDSYISAFAQGAAAFHQPLMLRFAHEMNSNWYPWAVGVNANTAADYIAAYRHVHSIFVSVGAANVTFVWSPNAIWRPGTDPTPMYPGSDVVDVVGLDGYNAGTAVVGGSWQDPTTIFGPTVARVKLVAPGKPILLAETASTEQGGNKAQWITQLVDYVRSDPALSGFVWTEYSGRVADWPIESSLASIDAMRNALISY